MGCLCVVILIFIFLTPKSWFENGERRRISCIKMGLTKLLVNPEVVENTEDKFKLEHKYAS